MASNQSVLEQMLQAALREAGSARDKEGEAAPSQRPAAGNLGDILGSLLGGGQMTAGGGATAEPGGAGWRWWAWRHSGQYPRRRLATTRWS